MPEKVLASGPAQESGEALHGVTVVDIDAAARQQFDLPATLKGALISKIDPDSVAYDAGLRKGDVIQEINRKPIESSEDAVAATKNLGGQRLMLRVWSRGGNCGCSSRSPPSLSIAATAAGSQSSPSSWMAH